MNTSSKGTLYVGSDRYAISIVAKVNDKTFDEFLEKFYSRVEPK